MQLLPSISKGIMVDEKKILNKENARFSRVVRAVEESMSSLAFR